MAKNCSSRSIDIISNILILIGGQDHVDTANPCSAVCLIMRSCSNAIRFYSFHLGYYISLYHARTGGEPAS